MQVIARTRIRTEHNCIARDMVQVGDYLLFGYNVFMGLKRVTQISDVLSLYRLIEPASADGEYQLEEVAINGTFLDQSAFVQDFEELYRYYKHTRLLQLTIRDGKLLIAFQIGKRVSDIRVFRFGLDLARACQNRLKWRTSTTEASETLNYRQPTILIGWRPTETKWSTANTHT